MKKFSIVILLMLTFVFCSITVNAATVEKIDSDNMQAVTAITKNADQNYNKDVNKAEETGAEASQYYSYTQANSTEKTISKNFNSRSDISGKPTLFAISKTVVTLERKASKQSPSPAQASSKKTLTSNRSGKVLGMVKTYKGELQISGISRPDKASVIIKMVNEERQKAGLNALKVDQTFVDAAQMRALELSVLFDHQRPDGRYSLDIIPLLNGENIAEGYDSTNKVMTAWMDSQGHKNNILQPRYTRINVSCIEVGSNTYWVQLFGL